MSGAIATSAITDQPQRLRVPQFEGAAAELLAAFEPEVCMDGPAGTGKSFAALWKMHLRRIMFPGSRGLLARKTLISLKNSTLVTYREQVLGPLMEAGYVKFWTARGDEPAHYEYWNGSKEIVVGLDKPGKAMSTEYDDVLVDEALDTNEADIEALLSRINRPGHLYGVDGRPPYAQLVLVTNPGPPHHWLNQRMNAGRTRRLISRHEDNPAMTASYLEMLATQLTGVRRSRLYLGLWAAADGMIYADAYDPALNIQDRGAISSKPHDLYGDCGIDHTWPRYLAVDFGYTERHPFVARWYAEDGEGALWMYREIYMTNRLVEDHAADIRKYSRWGASPHGDPLPRAIICDHDAEGRATLERHLGLRTTPADKRVLEGIQVVASRMRPAGDGRPRLYYLRDALVERDRVLVDAKRPTCGAEEVESYVWKLNGGTSSGRARDEVEKDNDHAMDCDRYLCMYRDMRLQAAKLGARLF